MRNKVFLLHFRSVREEAFVTPKFERRYSDRVTGSGCQHCWLSWQRCDNRDAARVGEVVDVPDIYSVIIVIVTVFAKLLPEMEIVSGLSLVVNMRIQGECKLAINGKK